MVDVKHISPNPYAAQYNVTLMVNNAPNVGFLGRSNASKSKAKGVKSVDNEIMGNFEMGFTSIPSSNGVGCEEPKVYSTS